MRYGRETAGVNRAGSVRKCRPHTPSVHAPAAAVPMAEVSVVIRDTRERTDDCLL